LYADTATGRVGGKKKELVKAEEYNYIELSTEYQL
jgi:hypothetical protein